MANLTDNLHSRVGKLLSVVEFDINNTSSTSRKSVLLLQYCLWLGALRSIVRLLSVDWCIVFYCEDIVCCLVHCVLF